ncbi:hypothetical protein BGY98DRAFT_995337 [Russula aff. rugulosa BPL654]|nr:hypothetical protein BGY98DRAFT_995337 [Russula aff. rugulosa BPL654]
MHAPELQARLHRECKSSSSGHTPGKSGSCATPPSGDMEVPNVPKQPRNLTININ